MRAGTVRIGDSLEKSPGIAALAQLFYDTVTGPAKLAMSAPSLQNYTLFMMSMGELLGVFKKGAAVPTNERALKLPAIADKHMASICQKLGQTADGRIELEPAAAAQVLPYVRELFAQQLIHAGKAGTILNQLFLTERSKDGFMRIRIHPNVLDGGFPALEQIAAATRNVLSEYYVGCELTYRKGVDVIVKAKEKEKVKVNLTESVLEGVRGKGGPAGMTAPVDAGATAARAARAVPDLTSGVLAGVKERAPAKAAAPVLAASAKAPPKGILKRPSTAPVTVAAPATATAKPGMVDIEGVLKPATGTRVPRAM